MGSQGLVKRVPGTNHNTFILMASRKDLASPYKKLLIQLIEDRSGLAGGVLIYTNPLMSGSRFQRSLSRGSIGWIQRLRCQESSGTWRRENSGSTPRTLYRSVASHLGDEPFFTVTVSNKSRAVQVILPWAPDPLTSSTSGVTSVTGRLIDRTTHPLPFKFTL